MKEFGPRGVAIEENRNLEGSWKLSGRLFPNQDPFLVEISVQVEGEMVEDGAKLRPRWKIKKAKRVTRIDFFRWERIRCTRGEKKNKRIIFPRGVWAAKFDPSKSQK